MRETPSALMELHYAQLQLEQPHAISYHMSQEQQLTALRSGTAASPRCSSAPVSVCLLVSSSLSFSSSAARGPQPSVLDSVLDVPGRSVTTSVINTYRKLSPNANDRAVIQARSIAC